MLDQFIELLEGEDWLTARSIRELTGWNERQIRNIAEQSDGYIISGQDGYKLTKNATYDEVWHASAWLRSQATKMFRRANLIERAAGGGD